MRLILRWIVTAAAVGAAAWLIPGIQVEGGAPALLAVALILGLVNALVRPIVSWLACGLVALTLGLFIFVINALMLLLTELIARAFDVGFSIENFTAALLGAIVISVVSFALSIFVPERPRRRRR